MSGGLRGVGLEDLVLGLSERWFDAGGLFNSVVPVVVSRAGVLGVSELVLYISS